LRELEEKHKDKLFGLYQSLEPAPPAKALFEEKIVAGVMEGGFTGEEFLRKTGFCWIRLKIFSAWP